MRHWRGFAVAIFGLVLGGMSWAAPGPGANPPGVDLKAIDTHINPCSDFYMYACGNWKKNHPIPADEPMWGRFNELQQRNQIALRKILEKASRPGTHRSPIERKVGNFYAACMNTARIQHLGLQPLRARLAAIESLHSRAQILPLVTRLQRHGTMVFFRLYSGPDIKNVEHVIAQIDQGGLGLPSRSYYLKTDAHSVKLRRQYEAYLTTLLRLAGRTPRQARAEVADTMRFENDLAHAARSHVFRRNPNHTYHMMTVTQLRKLAPGWAWPRYFRAMHTPPEGDVNVASLRFARAISRLARTEPLSVWRAYLLTHALSSAAPYLSHPFVAANFHFYGQILSGQKQNQPRWKRCVRYTDGNLGMALGRLYVKKYFPPVAKARALRMVREIQAALGRDLAGLQWLTPATRRKALFKLHHIANMIGYPDKWRNYAPLHISRTAFFADVQRAGIFNLHRNLVKIGRPFDRTHWQMTPPTVNAYYDPNQNVIVFPAGILQPPFYNYKADPASNFGGMGMVIGHENTHGFDDQGSRFGPHGNLHNWWTASDKKNFDQREDCFVHEYSKFTVNGNLHLNGRLTLGENTADNGGIRLAYMALLTELARDHINPNQPDGGGYTPLQRYFLSYGQIWCENATPQIKQLLAREDPHSPGRFRVNGVLENFGAFARAFHCGPGSPMVAGPKACRVW